MSSFYNFFGIRGYCNNGYKPQSRDCGPGVGASSHYSVLCCLPLWGNEIPRPFPYCRRQCGGSGNCPLCCEPHPTSCFLPPGNPLAVSSELSVFLSSASLPAAGPLPLSQGTRRRSVQKLLFSVKDSVQRPG